MEAGGSAARAWRIALVAGWLLASPFPGMIRLSIPLDRWPLVELVFLAGMVVVAWKVGRARLPDKVVVTP